MFPADLGSLGTLEGHGAEASCPSDLHLELVGVGIEFSGLAPFGASLVQVQVQVRVQVRDRVQGLGLGNWGSKIMVRG